MDDSFNIARRAKLLLIVEQVDDVLLKLASNPRASYSIDTGQGKETVTAASAGMLRSFVNNIIADIERLNEQINGTGDPSYMRPMF